VGFVFIRTGAGSLVGCRFVGVRLSETPRFPPPQDLTPPAAAACRRSFTLIGLRRSDLEDYSDYVEFSAWAAWSG
jgi:hypothetical protein